MGNGSMWNVEAFKSSISGVGTNTDDWLGLVYEAARSNILSAHLSSKIEKQRRRTLTLSPVEDSAARARSRAPTVCIVRLSLPQKHKCQKYDASEVTFSLPRVLSRYRNFCT